MSYKYTPEEIGALNSEIDRLRADLASANQSTEVFQEGNRQLRAALAEAERERDRIDIELSRTCESADEVLRRAERAKADLTAAVGLVERWLRHADRGHWRDKTGLGLSATPVADDSRAFVERTAAASNVPGPGGRERQ